MNRLLRPRAIRCIVAPAFTVLLLAAIGVSSAFASHYDLVDVEFVTDEEKASLDKVGIASTDVFLERAAKKAERKAIAEKTGLAEARLLELAKVCDLLRIRGIGPRMIKLFAAGNIHTVAQLKAQDGPALSKNLTEINDQKHIAGLVPPPDMVTAWVDQAKALPAVLEE